MLAKKKPFLCLSLALLIALVNGEMYTSHIEMLGLVETQKVTTEKLTRFVNYLDEDDANNQNILQ
jgi:hypothetical protein